VKEPIAAATPALEEDVGQSIRNASSEYWGSFATKKPEVVSGYYSDQAYLMVPGLKVMKGREAITEFYGIALSDGDDFQHETVDVEILGADAGIEIGQASYVDSKGTLHPSKYLMVWRRTDGVWRIDADIWNERSVN
jgi:uncharacterized protein (TIGR02246 family)